MDMIHRLEMLDAHQVADPFGIDHLFQLQEIGRIAQHMRQADDLLFVAGMGDQPAALVKRLRDRLFEQDIVTQVERPHTGFVMQVVGRRDNDRIGEFRPVEHLLPRCDPVFDRNAVFVPVHRTA